MSHLFTKIFHSLGIKLLSQVSPLRRRFPLLLLSPPVFRCSQGRRRRRTAREPQHRFKTGEAAAAAAEAQVEEEGTHGVCRCCCGARAGSSVTGLGNIRSPRISGARLGSGIKKSPKSEGDTAHSSSNSGERERAGGAHATVPMDGPPPPPLSARCSLAVES